MSNPKKVVILGAGISGLACANTLLKNGIACQIIEATDRVGGRIRTEVTSDGFRIDKGFQVLLSSYPELPQFLDLKKLELKNFKSGALIFKDSKMLELANPIFHPSKVFKTIFNTDIKSQDKLSLLKTIIQSEVFSRHSTVSGVSTINFLKQIGFTNSFIEFFWRPFLAGVYLDPELSLDSNYFLFLIRCFSLGRATVPRYGMEQMPKEMAALLPKEGFIFSEEVKSVAEIGGGVAIELASGREISADVVVQTYPPKNKTAWRSVTTYYLTGPRKLPWSNWLVLVPNRPGRKINHLAVMSEVSDSYAPPGRSLIAANVLGSTSLNEGSEIISEIETMAQQSLQLEVLRTETVRNALPVVELAEAGSPELNFLKRGPIYYCGDSLSNPSINFALKSGRSAALAISRDYFGKF